MMRQQGLDDAKEVLTSNAFENSNYFSLPGGLVSNQVSVFLKRTGSARIATTTFCTNLNVSLENERVFDKIYREEII